MTPCGSSITTGLCRPIRWTTRTRRLESPTSSLLQSALSSDPYYSKGRQACLAQAWRPALVFHSGELPSWLAVFRQMKDFPIATPRAFRLSCRSKDAMGPSGQVSAGLAARFCFASFVAYEYDQDWFWVVLSPRIDLSDVHQ
jgi:hypothetical protein